MGLRTLVRAADRMGTASTLSVLAFVLSMHFYAGTPWSLFAGVATDFLHRLSLIRR